MTYVPGMIAVAISVVVAVSALWVYWDASSNKIGKVPGASGLTNMSAGAWGTSMLFLWLLAFPLYIARRSALLEIAKEHPQESSSRPAKLVALAIPGAAMVLLQLGAASLPACDSQPVTALASQIVEQRLPGTQLRSFGEVEIESTSERRVCRVEAVTAIGTEWLKFSVEPHTNGQIFVQFLQ